MSIVEKDVAAIEYRGSLLHCTPSDTLPLLTLYHVSKEKYMLRKLQTYKSKMFHSIL
jgi:hypothetical protein